MAEKEIAKIYEPKDVETKWYREWETRGISMPMSFPQDLPTALSSPPPTSPACSTWGMR